jgi:hypothetical protein
MHSFFRVVAAATLMGALLLAYAAHPVAGWATLVALATLVLWKRTHARQDAVQAESSGA